MAEPIRQKDLLIMILEECVAWHNGDPIAILK
jgi:hypothetical protein